ncbi:hypothetical protein V6N12_045382 [Hibiscus sabdariffa]|uniref:Uncharacterized protein n=1 Tax=Hibiscus sabdariffa TaxID=183260 RepID=A0ABR2G374_9ROSI
MATLGNNVLPQITSRGQSHRMWMMDSRTQAQTGHDGSKERPRRQRSSLVLRRYLRTSQRNKWMCCVTGKDQMRDHLGPIAPYTGSKIQSYIKAIEKLPIEVHLQATVS